MQIESLTDLHENLQAAGKLDNAQLLEMSPTDTRSHDYDGDYNNSDELAFTQALKGD